MGPSSVLDGTVGSSSSQPGSARAVTPAAPSAPVPDLLGDLLDLDMSAPAPVAAPVAAGAGGVVDLLGGLDLGSGAPVAAAPVAAAAPAAPPSAPASTGPQLPVLVDASKGKGLVVRGAVIRSNNAPTYSLQFENVNAGGTLDGFMLQFNKNTFGLQPGNQVVSIAPLAPGTTASATVPLVHSAAMVSPAGNPNPGTLQVALKCNQLGVLYTADVVSLPAVLAENGKVESTAFVSAWKDVPESEEAQHTVGAIINDVGDATRRLEAGNLFVMANKSVGGEEVLYVTGRATVGAEGAQLLLELRFVKGQPGVRAFFRCKRSDLAQATFDAVGKALSS